MTPSELSVIRARLDAAPNATWNGSLMRFLCNDIRTLLDEVERLTKREDELVKAGLDLMVANKDLTAERDRAVDDCEILVREVHALGAGASVG